MKKITIITGHYGTGKTNFSVNLALNEAKKGIPVTVVDLDLVNPYFRTADFKELFADHGVTLIAPEYANSNVDLPTVSFDIEELAQQEGCLLIDVGGDDAGATALGRYADAIMAHGDEVDMLYVLNCYRYLTRTPEEALTLMQEIETASRLRHTGLVNNSNLGCETTAELITNSLPFAEEIAKQAGLPLLFTTADKQLNLSGDGFLPIDVFVKPLWEQTV
ncbi:MAG: cobalamin biosynthesis protein CobQ [Ruminococcus sp.]|nr:cobalamin biosynthesis protein CobQ [Ruminococcus sp.]MBQ8905449.1 cobalamin biosynthesis protein CobQ [Ruminococcus sp.]